MGSLVVECLNLIGGADKAVCVILGVVQVIAYPVNLILQPSVVGSTSKDLINLVLQLAINQNWLLQLPILAQQGVIQVLLQSIGIEDVQHLHIQGQVNDIRVSFYAQNLIGPYKLSIQLNTQSVSSPALPSNIYLITYSEVQFAIVPTSLPYLPLLGLYQVVSYPFNCVPGPIYKSLSFLSYQFLTRY